MQTDPQLVQATLDGDRHAFNTLIDRYESMVFGMALSRVKNIHDAQDIAQEVFLQAFLRLNTLGA
jgi:RNA polymerase sigma-70 factor (ECF subfamily)